MTLVGHPPAERVLRADAQRNLARVLEAARELFAEQGLDTPVTEIAERAGVGVGTIFRRFPTKHELLVAVVEHRVRTLVVAADQALGNADPEAALRGFLEVAAAAAISDRGFCDCAGTDLFARESVRELVAGLVARIDSLLRRAQRAGVVRRDVVAEDVPVLLMAVARTGLLLEEAAPGSWRRYLGLVLDGLKPDGARPLGHAPLTSQQIEFVRAGRRG